MIIASLEFELRDKITKTQSFHERIEKGHTNGVAKRRGMEKEVEESARKGRG